MRSRRTGAAMTVPPKPPKRPARTDAAKRRRKALHLARADERRAVEHRALLGRYEELKGAMRRAGLRIGSIADIAHKLDDPAARFEMLRARIQRWDALWSITLRKRETRGKIIIGGAVLAELADLMMHDPADRAILASVVSLLDRRVPRVRDRLVINELLANDRQIGAALPLRPGGPLDESLEDALAALGEGLAGFERGPAGGGRGHHEGEDAGLRELREDEGQER